MKTLQRLLVPLVLAVLLVLGIVRICDGDRADWLSEVAPARSANPRCLAVTHVGTRFHPAVEIMLCNEQWDHDYNSTQELRSREPKEAESVLDWVRQFRVSDAQLDNIVIGLRMQRWVPATKRDPANLQLDHLTIIDGVPYQETFKAVSTDDLRAVYRILLSEVTEPDVRKAIDRQSEAFTLK